MAKAIKDLKGSFDFTGVITKRELKKSKEEGKNGKFEFYLLDKDLESEVKLEMWEGSDAAYWDNSNKTTIKVTENIPTVMKEVRANATGNPFSVKAVAGGKEVEYFINNDIIAFVNKLTLNKHIVNVTGSMSFKEYQGKVYKEYKIERIEAGSKKPIGFNVKFPAVISEMSKSKFVYGDMLRTVPILVKSKLENKQWGYRSITLGLDKNHFLGGVAITASKKLNIPALEIINDNALPSVLNNLNLCKGYTSGLIIGRLKVGHITKKPTEADLNPMEKIVLKMQGEEAVKERLDSMDIINEYFDSMYLHSFDVHDSIFFEEINEAELNLPVSNSSNSSIIGSNPMMDIINNLTAKGTEVEEVKVEETEVTMPEPEVKAAEEDELANLVAQQEAEVTGGANDSDDFDEDSFPF